MTRGPSRETARRCANSRAPSETAAHLNFCTPDYAFSYDGSTPSGKSDGAIGRSHSRRNPGFHSRRNPDGQTVREILTRTGRTGRNRDRAFAPPGRTNALSLGVYARERGTARPPTPEGAVGRRRFREVGRDRNRDGRRCSAGCRLHSDHATSRTAPDELDEMLKPRTHARRSNDSDKARLYLHKALTNTKFRNGNQRHRLAHAKAHACPASGRTIERLEGPTERSNGPQR